MQEAYNYLNQKLNNNDVVVVAVSGGPDSMALLHLLLKLEKNIKIVVAHVNHNVRIESEQEKIFVENYCKQNDIIFEYMKIEKYVNNKFSEVEARQKRYDFFKEILKKYNSKYLLTAHHGDDLMETILMRIVRGSSLKGYSGFKQESIYKEYNNLKPLITTTKDEIMKYLNNNNLEYVIDSSNEKDLYTRNRYRKYILPALKNENELVHLKFKKFSETLISVDNYIEKQAEIEISKIYNGKINIKKFLDLDDVIQKRIINIILEKMYLENLPFLNDIHIDNIINLIKNSKNNAYLNLPNDVVVIKEYGNLEITTKKTSKEFNIKLKNKNNLENGKIIEIIDHTNLDNNFICRLSKEEVKFPLYIRNKKNGDKFFVKGMNHSKKVSDIFIDCKIPKNERNTFPIVVDSNDVIVWLPGIKKSKFDRTKDEKYDIILKYY